jgi:hypothetical protein
MTLVKSRPNSLTEPSIVHVIEGVKDLDNIVLYYVPFNDIKDMHKPVKTSCFIGCM